MTTNRRTFVATTALAAMTARAGHAQEATPSASPIAGDAYAAAVAELRYQHPEKLYYYSESFQNPDLLAGLVGVDGETYRAIHADFEEQNHIAAMDLLADPVFTERVANLSFPANSIILGIGESSMDDRLSAFEILRHLVAMQRPDDGITFVNMAISGQSTAEAVSRLPGYLAMFQPTHVYCAIGGNDAIRYGIGASKTRVSIEETRLNLAEARAVTLANTTAEWIWQTRPTIDEERVAAYPGFAYTGIQIFLDDLLALNAAIRDQEGTIVDLEGVFPTPPADMLEDDGLHPSPSGQRELARAIVESLTA